MTAGDTEGNADISRVHDHPDAPYVAQSERIVSIKSAQAAKKLKHKAQSSEMDESEGTNNE